MIVGPSGSGKSTILNLISGFLTPSKGSISYFDGEKEVSLTASGLGSVSSYMLVDRNEIPYLSAFDNLSLVSKDEKKILDALAFFDLTAVKNLKAAKLSKGERARLALARMRLLHTPIALYDEPTANLDEENAEKVFSSLRNGSKGKIVIVCTHDPETAIRYADRVFSLNNGAIKVENQNQSFIQSPETAVSENPSFEGRKAPLWKLGFWKAFSKKLPYFLSSLILSITLLSAFAGTSMFRFDKVKTFSSGVSSLDGEAYLCSDSRLTREVSPKKHFSSLEGDDSYGFGTISLSLGRDGSLAAAIFGESEAELPLDKSPDLHPDILSSFVDDGTTKYYPIALSDEQIETILEIKGIEYEPGDILPLSFNDVSEVYKETFILSDVFHVESGSSSMNYLGNLYPAFISRSSYLKHIDRVGVMDSGLDEAMTSLVSDYNDFVRENSLDESLAYEGIASFPGGMSSLSKLAIPCYEKLSDVPLSGGYLVSGSFPTKDDEIMINDDQTYSLLGLSHSSETDAFFTQYSDGFPLVLFEDFPTDLYGGKMKIVGSIDYVMPGNNPISRNSISDVNLISDSLYEKISAKITEDYYHPSYPAKSHVCYSKDYLAKASSLIEEKIVVTRDSTINSFPYLVENVSSMAKFISVVALIAFALGAVVFLFYCGNIANSLEGDFSLMEMWGVPGSRIAFSYLASIISLVGAPLIISVSFGYLVLHFLSLSLVSNVAFSGLAYFSYGTSYFVVLGIVLVLCVLSFIPFFASKKKKKALESVRNG